MPSRRQIREAAIQFLYCYDLEGGVLPPDLRAPFWDFVTESDRKNLQVAIYRTVHHLANGREARLVEFVERSETAAAHLTAHPPAESLQNILRRLLALESSWSLAFSQMERIPRDGDDADVADSLENSLEKLFKIDRDLAFNREQFLNEAGNFPTLKAHTEAVAASIRRLQRISERLRMVEEPEKFPEQADLGKLRDSQTEITELRLRTDELVDAVLASKEAVDGKLAAILDNYQPERIDPVDRAILRLGTYELLFTNTPQNAVINEAVELAKRFGTSDSKRFVNGLLDRVAKDTKP